MKFLKSPLLLFAFLFFAIGYSQQKKDVFFDFNQDVPHQNSLQDLQKWMQENPNAQILKVYGYCDSVDDTSYNKELSLRRIESVLKIMNENQIRISAAVEKIPMGKDFKRSAIQEENRKVTFYYQLLKEPVNEIKRNEEIPTVGDLNKKIEWERKGLSAKFNMAKNGDIIKIENIYFYLDSDKIIEMSRPLLDELYTIMKSNPKLKIQIQGHICCNNDDAGYVLSAKRALTIKAFLLEKEILFNRLSYKAFGSTKPVYKIPEKNEAERLANRRVEILIVSK